MRKIHKLLIISILIGACTSNQNEEEGIKSEISLFNREVKVFVTAENSDLRLSFTGTKKFDNSRQPLETEISVFVNPDVTFQSFIGIGGAITDASAEVFTGLSDSKKRELLTSYYDIKDGIGYSLARTSIHSCDFSSESYTYIEDGDKNLDSFSIDHDRQFRIPMIKSAIEAAGGQLLIYASPWSPPAFMKSNNNMLQGGRLLEEFYKPWALYYARFIKEYEKENIPIWGLTVQNEPMATQRWESCIYTAVEERDFLKNYLGPTLEEEGLGDKKIIIWDHNRDMINHRVNTILADPDASKYVWGIGFHWYETWAGGDPMFHNVTNVNQSFPSKNLIFTEGCAESFRENEYETWSNAERYGESMIFDFNNGTVGWTDWNILLDDRGGPNHVENFCIAPVHANINNDELIYTPSYYYIGHFSKFIRPGAKRVSTVTSRSHLMSTSFINEDKSIVTVVMNKTDEEINYKVYAGEGVFDEIIPSHAIQTFVY